MAIKVLLFGGTFNPIHHGHLILAQHVMTELNFDKVVFIPSARPALKDIDISFERRSIMATLAISGNMDFEISDIENEIDGPSYTIETIRRIRHSYLPALGDYEVYWLIGPDNLESLKDWYKIDELVEECSFVLGVPDDHKGQYSNIGMFDKDILEHTKWFNCPPWRDFPFYKRLAEKMIAVQIPQIDIRSTTIREKIAKGQPIKYMTPLMVERYIDNYGLYKTTEQKPVVSCQGGGSDTGT